MTSRDFEELELPGMWLFQSDGLVQGYANFSHSLTMKEAYDFLIEHYGWKYALKTKWQLGIKPRIRKLFREFKNAIC